MNQVHFIQAVPDALNTKAVTIIIASASTKPVIAPTRLRPACIAVRDSESSSSGVVKLQSM